MSPSHPLARLLVALSISLLAAAGVHAGEAVAPAAASSELIPATSTEVVAAARAAGAKVVLVNTWATWCTPCRQEFPDLMRFYRAYKDRGVKLLLVSGDFASDTAPAKDFLASQGVDFPSYLKSGGDEDFINGFDPAWSGALPATFVFDAKGTRVHSFLGPITYESLEQVVAPLVGAGNPN
jgi:thiol-disulfide isomerase/thioredoxin